MKKNLLVQSQNHSENILLNRARRNRRIQISILKFTPIHKKEKASHDPRFLTIFNEQVRYDPDESRYISVSQCESHLTRDDIFDGSNKSRSWSFRGWFIRYQPSWHRPTAICWDDGSLHAACRLSSCPRFPCLSATLEKKRFHVIENRDEIRQSSHFQN